MTQIAVLGDTHFGCRNDNKRISAFQIDFFENQFFPYLEKNNIDTIIQTGDFFDNRKFISMSCLANAREYFVNKCIEKGYTVHVIAGNHDLPYKLNNQHSSVKQLLSDFPNFHVYENECKKVGNVTFVPWISPDNKESITKVLDTGGEIVVGHFETTSFLMEKNQICTHGTTTLENFTKWDLVISGHFHRRSRRKNVTYVGVPYEMSFHDADQEKGFHILDTETKKLKLVKNTSKLFNIIQWDSSEDNEIPELKSLKDTFVKLMIYNNDDPVKTNKLISLIDNESPHDFKIVDKSSIEIDSDSKEDKKASISTEEVITKYVKGMTDDHKLKDKILDMTLRIYKEAKELQDSERT